MRTKIATALVGVGIAVSLLPVNAASASCWYITEDLDCVQPPCLADYYDKADAKLGDKLPDDPFVCMT